MFLTWSLSIWSFNSNRFVHFIHLNDVPPSKVGHFEGRCFTVRLIEFVLAHDLFFVAVLFQVQPAWKGQWLTDWPIGQLLRVIIALLFGFNWITLEVLYFWPKLGSLVILLRWSKAQFKLLLTVLQKLGDFLRRPFGYTVLLALIGHRVCLLIWRFEVQILTGCRGVGFRHLKSIIVY